ncbi:YbaY family lipoprotein [Pseudomonas panipatensis]|uniref:Putative lipoprotein n=1 Tax=Pseudomonas panipatensis TaxID=428992 RepID=A0A1G8DNB0_9PSED|nr:YbaY family lipoprotein [Pseudomonas panipatensis]SDH58999.1 putative lipoprotein [Pseudomonas panipatensis]SMP40718.1 putative lipoprotein [Pseudomonas panipatensis]
MNRQFLPLVLMAGLLSACASPAPEPKAALRGEVFYLQRIALPPSAQVSVSLQDVSLADAPALELAHQTLPGGQQVPIAFTLEYDPKQVKPGHSYALSARIENAGRLLFTNTERHSVKLDGSDPQPLRIRVDAVR